MTTTTSPRVCLVAMALALACVLLVRSADAEASPTPGLYGCNPATDKTCKPEGGVTPVVLPGGGIDLDGDGDEDELPQFSSHLTILGHAN